MSFSDAFEDSDWFERVTGVDSPLLVGGGFPPINLSVTDDRFIIRAELPGIDRANLDISIAERSMSIRGRRLIEFPEGALVVHRERNDGFFRRTIALPENLDSVKADASYANGILTVSLPWKAAAQARQIEVKTA